ncbi:fimbrial protein [Pseudomonas sp. 1912-s]|uniref:fimbrial protein n=1 Tax=Pseudomonas sp. 1912-s TaxID=3033802 RepID=UPI0023DFDA78|nr:fimbrial protein [Pseudomonas sp. 1912-s]MDF3202867.1 fimbrial protein [Pseudomonas sp. 1912-s]
MKSNIILLIVLYFFGSDTVKAVNNPDHCERANGNSDNTLVLKVIMPALLDLKYSPVGLPMYYNEMTIYYDGISPIKCPWPAVAKYRLRGFIDNAPMADGFTDVYKTGLAGVGIRFQSLDPDLYGTIPQERELANTNYKSINIIKTLRIYLVRTSREVTSGEIDMNFTIHQYVNGWNTADIKIVGTTKVQSENYFSGCSGVEKLNISMGRIPIGDLGSKQTPFNLDVLCSGLPAGTKVPVNVYFEGDSDGPGRLNLEPGGAQGVEISLVNDRGAKLPFSLGGALAMTWIRSEPQGEIYRLPVVAEYAKKSSQKAGAGRANATLNYVLEYN